MLLLVLVLVTVVLVTVIYTTLKNAIAEGYIQKVTEDFNLFSIFAGPVAVVAILATYFLEILIDNTSARVKWHTMFKLAWGVTILIAGVNLIILMVI